MSEPIHEGEPVTVEKTEEPFPVAETEADSAPETAVVEEPEEEPLEAVFRASTEHDIVAETENRRRDVPR